MYNNDLLFAIQLEPKKPNVALSVIYRRRINKIAPFISFSKLENLYFDYALFLMILVSWPVNIDIP
jgi:hypothetical protein